MYSGNCWETIYWHIKVTTCNTAENTELNETGVSVERISVCNDNNVLDMFP